MNQITRRGLFAGTAGLIVASCSSGGDDDPSASPSTPSRTPKPRPSQTPTPAPPAVWPLTGIEVDGGSVDHPVLAVKIDNSSNARPQIGLQDADLIAEELVEGGLTRLVVMYHSALPDVAGPVRSIRTTDIGLVKPADATLVASGGAGRVLEQMDDAGVTVIEEGSPGFSRAGDRSAPYNVMIEPAAVRDAADGVTAPSQNYLPWGSGTPGGEAATQATVQFSGTHVTHWEYDGSAWRRVDGMAADGTEFAATTLLILRVTTRDAGYEDPGGNFVPETVLTGDGDVVLLTGGAAAQGTWSKSDAAEPFALYNSDGEELTVPPGRTWIELVPEAGSVSYS